jgi:4-hydroxy-4-methyl-2-oxoglutarate aldolase
MSDEIQRWRIVPVAVAVDVSGGACQIDPAIRPLRPPGQQPRLFGKAVTAICEPPDFGAVLRAIDLIRPGDVLVIDARSNRETAMIGEILGGHLRRRGAAGIVCDGAVRDVAELASWHDFSVFARFITPRGPTGVAHGTVNGPAMVGGLRVNPGDLMIGDDDGLCALAPDMIRSLIDSAEAKLALESKWQSSLAADQTIAQTFGLKP